MRGLCPLRTWVPQSETGAESVLLRVFDARAKTAQRRLAVQNEKNHKKRSATSAHFRDFRDSSARDKRWKSLPYCWGSYSEKPVLPDIGL